MGDNSTIRDYNCQDLYRVLSRAKDLAGFPPSYNKTEEATEVGFLINAFFEHSYHFVSLYNQLVELGKGDFDKAKLDKLSDILMDIDVTFKHELMERYQDNEETFHMYMSRLTSGYEEANKYFANEGY